MLVDSNDPAYPAHFPYSPSSIGRIIKCSGSINPPPSPPTRATRKGHRLHAKAEEAITAYQVDLYPEVQPYVSYVIDEFETCGTSLSSEQKIVSDTVANYGGTIDAIIWHPTQLHVIDLKTGSYPVQAKDNPQVMSYLCLARQHFPADVYKGTIFQYNKPSSHIYSSQQLDDHDGAVLEASFRTDRVAGSHCRWCGFKPTCQEYKEYKK